MLTEEEKQRIKEEEIFRTEVQKSLAEQNSSQTLRNKLWAFMNTSLGIWVLSTIVIGLLGWSYAQWQQSRDNSGQIDKLDVEIEARFESTLVARTQENYQLSLYLANSLLLPPKEEKMVQPEFANRNLQSLLYELAARTSGDERIDVEQTIKMIRDIESEYLNKQLIRNCETN